jgi:hypothetical protein
LVGCEADTGRCQIAGFPASQSGSESGFVRLSIRLLGINPKPGTTVKKSTLTAHSGIHPLTNVPINQVIN